MKLKCNGYFISQCCGGTIRDESCSLCGKKAECQCLACDPDDVANCDRVDDMCYERSKKEPLKDE